MSPKKSSPFIGSVHAHENSLSVIFGVIFIVAIGFFALNLLAKDKGAPSVSTISEEQSGSTQARTHKVEKGEDLWKISEKTYGDGYKWVEIAKANNISNPGLIEVDTELILPDIPSVQNTPAENLPEATETLTATPAQVVLTDNQNAITSDKYTVIKGDNLWDICVRAYGNGYKWVEVSKVNNIKNPNIILPGMKLTLPR